MSAFLLASSAVGCGGGGAPPPDLTPEARILFADDDGGFAASELNAMAATLGVALTPDSAGLVDGACGEPIGHTVTFRDLNGDGSAEVILDYGNTCWSGMAGTSVTVFVRGAGGDLEPNFGVPGMIAEVRESPDGGYADLLIGGPGFCWSLWSWDGQVYEPVRNEPQAPGGCDNRGG